MADRKSVGSVSLVRQGEHRFYSFTIDSNLLAETSYVVNREEDPNEGFQRELDKRRAQEIANYIDSGLGTIPSSIILSAQPECNFEYNSKSKSISFDNIAKAFLIIDGQHRVYGFRLAETALRIPVVVYDNLSKRDETRLFIDVNSKQKGVRSELLLDIKKQAEYETDTEEYLRELFDLFHKDSDSVLYNRLSPSKRAQGKITRSVFNTSVKPLYKIFGNKTPSEVYDIFNSYLVSFEDDVLSRHELEYQMYSTTIFKAICGFFPSVAGRVKDKFGSDYSIDHFHDFLNKTGQRVKANRIANPGNAYKPLVDHFEETLKQDLTL